jgi:hypothetical protein
MLNARAALYPHFSGLVVVLPFLVGCVSDTGAAVDFALAYPTG